MNALKKFVPSLFVILFGTGLAFLYSPEASAETESEAISEPAVPPSQESPAGPDQTLPADQDQDIEYTIFDDLLLLSGYTDRYSQEPKDVILAMIKDDTLSDFRMAAAVRVFKQKYREDTLSKEKKVIEKILLRRLKITDSPFVQVEIMESLCLMDRYKYFNSMVPILMRKLDHYNSAVNEIAYSGINHIIEQGNHSAREARIVFSLLRKNLFLSRRRLANVKEPGPRLTQKLHLLRWSIKILGTQELKRLPEEVINLL